MTTEYYSAFSIEEGDTIILKGDAYRVMSVGDGQFQDYAFRIMDEEGYMHTFECDTHTEIKVVCDVDHNEYA